MSHKLYSVKVLKSLSFGPCIHIHIKGEAMVHCVRIQIDDREPVSLEYQDTDTFQKLISNNEKEFNANGKRVRILYMGRILDINVPIHQQIPENSIVALSLSETKIKKRDSRESTKASDLDLERGLRRFLENRRMRPNPVSIIRLGNQEDFESEGFSDVNPIGLLLFGLFCGVGGFLIMNRYPPRIRAFLGFGMMLHFLLVILQQSKFHVVVENRQVSPSQVMQLPGSFVLDQNGEIVGN